MFELLRQIRDPAHPLGSPLLGRLVSRIGCEFGHDPVVMELDEWHEPWVTCTRCGGRFFPASALEESEEVDDAE